MDFYDFPRHAYLNAFSFWQKITRIYGPSRPRTSNFFVDPRLNMTDVQIFEMAHGKSRLVLSHERQKRK